MQSPYESSLPWYLKVRADSRDVERLRSIDLALKTDGRTLTNGEQAAIRLVFALRDVPQDQQFQAARRFLANAPELGAMALPEVPEGATGEAVTFDTMREALQAKGVDLGGVDFTDVRSEAEALAKAEAHRAELAAQAEDGDTLTPAESIDLSDCTTSAEVREAYRRAGRHDLAAKVV